MKYTIEKVLYFASRDVGLNVDIDERSDTTLSKIVRDLVSEGKIEQVANDDAGKYYKLTEAGKVKHQQYRDQYRRKNSYLRGDRQ